MNPVPGIHLYRLGNALGAEACIRSPATGRDFTATAALGNWLFAGVVSRLAPDHARAQDPDGVVVLFDGYLTDIVGGQQAGRPPASVVLDAYRTRGPACVHDLRGSFTMLVADPHTESALLFTDRCTTRPSFYRTDGDGTLRVAPEVGALVQDDEPTEPIDAVALCQFLLSGSYFSDCTLFPRIRKLPGGTSLSITREGQSLFRYWRMAFRQTPEISSEEGLVDECDALLRQAVTRHVRSCREPVLLLSGGIDSRLIFGSLLREGHRIPVATYGTDRGDDRPLAAALARRYGLELHEFVLPQVPATVDMIDVSSRADGRAEMIDSASKVRDIDALSAHFSSFLEGDKNFDAKPARNIADALTKLGLLSLHQAPRLLDWLQPDLRRGVARRLREELDGLVAGTGQRDVYDVRDVLYSEHRLGNRQNGYAGAWLRTLEPVRPWLDEDVLDFVCRLAPAQRVGKHLLKALYRKHYADMTDIAFAQSDSIPLPRDLQAAIRDDADLARLLHAELYEALDPRLRAIIQPEKIAQAVACLSTGRPLPPVAASWRDHVPGLWRFFPRRPDATHPVSLLFRLLQIQLYLRALGNPLQGRQGLP